MPGAKASAPSGVELLGLGVMLAAAVVVPLVVGIWVDGRLSSAPAGVLGGLLLGIVAAVAVVYVRFRRYW